MWSKKYCEVCGKRHYMIDEGDIYDCYVYYRNKNKRKDENIEIWKDGKWVRRDNDLSAL